MTHKRSWLALAALLAAIIGGTVWAAEQEKAAPPASVQGEIRFDTECRSTTDKKCCDEKCCTKEEAKTCCEGKCCATEKGQGLLRRRQVLRLLRQGEAGGHAAGPAGLVHPGAGRAAHRGIGLRHAIRPAPAAVRRHASPVRPGLRVQLGLHDSAPARAADAVHAAESA